MIHKKKKKKYIMQYILSLAFMACLLFGLVYASSYIATKTVNETDRTLKEAIARASVQCYAIEGRYPPDVKYLEDNYGIIIDNKEYNVFYEGFASNIMPDITVVRAETGK